MLKIPSVGFAHSVKKHNVNMLTACDWVEANVLFVEEKVSKADIIDVLCDGEYYKDQDFASEFVDNLWVQLRKRIAHLNEGSPFEIEATHIKRTKDWRQVPAYSFCLLLCLASYYKKWAEKANAEYIRQGHLFEKLTKESLEQHGWQVMQTGWSGDIENDDFTAIVKATADYLHEDYINEPIVDLFEDAKDEGLDLVCHRPFIDNRGGRSAYFVQCASGANWTRKLKEPDISGVWSKLITFSSPPLRACALPYAVEDKAFFIACGRVEGMLLDRYRLLEVGHTNADWVSTDLAAGIIEWLEPRVASLIANLDENSSTPPAIPPVAPVTVPAARATH